MPLLAKEASAVKCLPQTFLPANSATSVTEEKKKNKQTVGIFIYLFIFFAVISVVKAAAKSSSSRLQQKLNTLL